MPGVTLTRLASGALRVLRDDSLLARLGIIVAFTERTGGRSKPPYASLNLASHVGDDPVCVDENRSMLLHALGIERLRDRLTVPEQVHGVAVRLVDAATAGAGAFAAAQGAAPVPGTDALVTREWDVPLMLCFADCVPVVLVAPAPVRTIAVVHAGWKGALARLPGVAARRVASEAGCRTADLIAYVGPYIGPDRYQVGAERVSQFVNSFGSIAAARDRLDLGVIVSQTLCEVGVPPSSQVVSGLHTAGSTDRFFSYREEGVTGRHAAVACIVGSTAG